MIRAVFWLNDQTDVCLPRHFLRESQGGVTTTLLSR